MKNLFRAAAAVAVATLASGTLIAGLAVAAHAAGSPPWEPVSNPPQAGGLTFYNAAGQRITGGSTTVSPLAAYVEGTNTVRSGDTVATLDGYTPVNGVPAGQWSGEQLSGSTKFPNASAPAPLNTATLPVVTGSSTDEDLSDYQQDYPNNDTSTTDGYAGLYVLRLYTGAAGEPITTSYDSADIQITGTTWSVVYPAVTLTPTTTTLTTTPSSPQAQGTSVTLKASISPSAPGTVQFEYGSTDIGSPVTVSGGTASLSTTALPVGTDTLSAIFTPAQFAAYGGSTGSTSFTVSSASFHISTASLPDAVVGSAYSQQLTTSGGSGTVKWKKVSLPKGFKLSATGLLTGTPSAKATGVWNVEVSASLNKATPVTATIPLTVEEDPAFSAKAPLSTSFQDGTSSTFTIAASGYPAPSISESGSLPSGVTFSDGVLSGTPAAVTNTVSYPLTITASNGVGATASESFTLTAVAPLAIATNSLPSATSGTAYGPVTLAATGGEGAYKWKKVSLPKGLALSSTGVLSGTPSSKVAAGPTSVVVQVTSKEGKTKVTAQKTLTLTVGAAG